MNPPPYHPPRRLYRDPRRAWIGGVCAGIAGYLGVPVFWVRLLTVLPFLSPLMPFVTIAYFIAVLRIPTQPESFYRNPEEEEFARAVNYSPAATFGQVRHTMRDLEHRLRRMEAYVTSAEFEFHEGMKRGS